MKRTIELNEGRLHSHQTAFPTPLCKLSLIEAMAPTPGGSGGSSPVKLSIFLRFTTVLPFFLVLCPGCPPRVQASLGRGLGLAPKIFVNQMFLTSVFVGWHLQCRIKFFFSRHYLWKRKMNNFQWLSFYFSDYLMSILCAGLDVQVLKPKAARAVSRFPGRGSRGPMAYPNSCDSVDLYPA